MVEDSILMPGAAVRAGAQVRYAIVAERAVIGAGAQVGTGREEHAPRPPITVVAGEITVEAGAVVPAGTMLTEQKKGGDRA